MIAVLFVKRSANVLPAVFVAWVVIMCSKVSSWLKVAMMNHTEW